MELLEQTTKPSQSSQIVPLLEPGRKLPLLTEEPISRLLDDSSVERDFSKHGLPDETTRRLYSEVEPSIVTIKHSSGSVGSGFIVGGTYVLTAAHVIESKPTIDNQNVSLVTTSNGDVFVGRVKKQNIDKKHDIALLSLSGADESNLPSLTVNELAKPSNRGWLLGHPFGLSPTYISPSNYLDSGTGYDVAIKAVRGLEASASMNYQEVRKTAKDISQFYYDEGKRKDQLLHRPGLFYSGHTELGNSGGPLVNEKGEVLGIFTGSLQIGYNQNPLLMDSVVPIKYAIPLLKKEHVSFR